jgi:DNA-binding MarR family transcriptional regulator
VSTTSKRPTYLDEREATAWRAYRTLVQEVTTSISSDLAVDSGLSDADYSVLSNLSEATDTAMRVLELADRLGWAKGRASHQIVRMEQRGLVERRPHESDGRGSIVVLTRAGRSAIKAAAPAHVASVRRHFLDHLNEMDRNALLRIAARVSSFSQLKQK